MSFPKKRFGFISVGWKDLGEIRGKEFIKNNEEYRSFVTHDFCRTRVKIGREDKDGELFYFCPRCMIKVDNEL